MAPTDPGDGREPPPPPTNPDPPPIEARVFRDVLSRILASRTDAPREAAIDLGAWASALPPDELL